MGGGGGGDPSDGSAGALSVGHLSAARGPPSIGSEASSPRLDWAVAESSRARLRLPKASPASGSRVSILLRQRRLALPIWGVYRLGHCQSIISSETDSTGERLTPTMIYWDRPFPHATFSHEHFIPSLEIATFN